MASSYKYFADHDRTVVNNQLLEEVSNKKGVEWFSSSNAPYYFLQVASGNTSFETSPRVFDVTLGRSSATVAGLSTEISVEQNIYNQFAKILLGHNSDNTITKFNLDPNDSTGDKVLHNALFINFSRNQFKDKIRRGTFDLKINVSGSSNIHLKDSSSIGYSTLHECETGEYALLYASSSDPGFNITTGNQIQGFVFYEAGVAVVSPYIFAQSGSNDNPSGSNTYLANNKLGVLTGGAFAISGSSTILGLIADKTIQDNSYALASHVLTASYQSVTELNSTIYFCRAFNHEFNYSSNPTYLENSKMVVKGDDPEALPRTYITTVGLYGDDNQLLAVAKLSEPVLKTPENEIIAKVRLDF